MGFMYWFRVGMMIVSLTAVIVLMRTLSPSQDHSSPMLKWLGFQSDNLVNICPTRVVGLKGVNGVAYLNEGLKWFKYDKGVGVELDPVAMEKWFADHCILKAELMDPDASATEVMNVFFVNGETKPLNRATSGVFTFGDRHFKSEQLDRAISELEAIAVHTRPSQ